MKYLLVCGGTAGHINPAIAIADLIKADDKNAEILFVGTKNGMENTLVAREGYPIHRIDVRGIPRKISFATLKAASLAITAPARAKTLLKKLRPHIVIGTGGYVSWPLAVAAHKLHIPVLLHESNAVPGLAVRMSERYATRILLQFEEAKQYLKHKEKAVFVGAPLRRGFGLNKDEAKRRLGIPAHTPLVVSFGGSLGSDALNAAVLEYLSRHSDTDPHFFWIHGCGKNAYSYIKSEAESFPPNFRILPYIENMGTVMSGADITITRAGAATLAELSAVGTAAVLVPSPNVTNDHQTKNALALASKGAAVLLEESALATQLADRVDDLLTDPQKRRRLSDGISALHFKDSDTKIKAEIKNVTRFSNNNSKKL